MCNKGKKYHKINHDEWTDDHKQDFEDNLGLYYRVYELSNLQDEDRDEIILNAYISTVTLRNSENPDYKSKYKFGTLFNMEIVKFTSRYYEDKNKYVCFPENYEEFLDIEDSYTIEEYPGDTQLEKEFLELLSEYRTYNEIYEILTDRGFYDPEDNEDNKKESIKELKNIKKKYKDRYIKKGSF